jgi:hypothetical protein
MSDKDLIIKFAREKAGVECLPAESHTRKIGIKGGFLDYLYIDEGKVWYFEAVDLDDFLHEVGHLAITPRDLRPSLDSDCCFDHEEGIIYEELYGSPFLYWSEQSVIAWTYFAWVDMGYNPIEMTNEDVIEQNYRSILRSVEKGFSVDTCTYHLIGLRMLDKNLKIQRWSYD